MTLVERLAKKYCFGDRELYLDLKQVGAIGLLKAERTYNARRVGRAKPENWQYLYVRGEILHYLRQFPVGDWVLWEDEEELVIPDERHSDYELIDLRNYIDWLMHDLSTRERAVIRSVYLEEHTQAEAAKLLRLNEMMVCRDLRSALRKLRARSGSIGAGYVGNASGEGRSRLTD